MESRPSGIVLAVSALVSLAALPIAACRAEAPPAEVRRLADDAIAFPARVNRAGFNGEGFGGMPGYHAVVWRGGRAADSALFVAEVSDVQILDALEALGAVPGDRLTLETWEKRRDPDHPAPDRLIAGPGVEISVRLPGDTEPVALAELLEDSAGRGLDMRFGGHRAVIPVWRSGCAVCLYSCPGSKVGNARYTVRDYERGVTRFRARTELLPADGERVEVVFRLTGSSGGGPGAMVD